jgi:AcrR family transcriptional regulator
MKDDQKINFSVKDQIIQLGMKKFFVEGFKAVNMNQLASELQISKKTLYKYFDSKEDLLLACLEERNKKFQEGLAEMVHDDSKSFQQKIPLLVEFISNELDSTSSSFYSEVKSIVPTIFEANAKRSKDQGFEYLIKLMEEGKKSNWIKKDVDVVFFSVIYSCALNQFLDPDFRNTLPEKVRDQMPNEPLEIYNKINKILFEGVLEKSILADLK